MPNLLERRLTFGGDIIPALIASAPKVIRPVRKITTVQIPGSNREIIEMEDAWESYEQPYSLFVGDGTPDAIQSQLNDVATALYKTGWQILLDDYDPDYFRLAYYIGPFDVQNKKTRVGTFDVTFKCRPERYLITGNTPLDVQTGESLFNPTAFNAKPLIHIIGSGNGMLTVNGTTMSFEGISDYLNIDCDTMNVYRLPSENRNSLMTGDFPVLKQGENLVSFTGGISAVLITPRWWTI